MDINAGLEYLMKEKSIRSTYVPVDLLTCAIMEHTRIVYWTKTNKYNFKVQFWSSLSFNYINSKEYDFFLTCSRN